MRRKKALKPIAKSWAEHCILKDKLMITGCSDEGLLVRKLDTKYLTYLALRMLKRGHSIGYQDAIDDFKLIPSNSKSELAEVQAP